MKDKLLFKIFLIIWLPFFYSANIRLNAQDSGHALWDSLLKKHVDVNGWIDYGGFTRDSFILNQYLQGLSLGAPDHSVAANDRLAWWMNAYNAYTVQLIIRHPGIKSIKEIGGKLPHVNSSWDLKFIKIGKRRYDLNAIEHGIIRKKFKEPRIHMALVCAAKSCPALRREAYKGKLLEEQLDDQCKRFLADSEKNKITSESVRISKIFDWYAGDFDRAGGVIAFISKYTQIRNVPQGKPDYLPYNWELNGHF